MDAEERGELSEEQGSENLEITQFYWNAVQSCSEIIQSYLDGVSALEQEQWDEALDLFQRLAERQLETAKQMEEALRKIEDQLSEEMISFFEWHKLQVEKKFRDAAVKLKKAHYGLGRQLLATREFEKAISHFKPLAEDNYPDASARLREAYRGLGQQLLTKGDFDRAQECFEKAGDDVGVEEAQKRKQREEWFRTAQEELENARLCHIQGRMDLAEKRAKKAERLFRQVRVEEPDYRDGAAYEGLKQVQQLLHQIEPWNRLSNAWKASNFSDVLIYGNQILKGIPWLRQIFDGRYRDVVAKCRHARKQLQEPMPKRKVPEWLICIGVAVFGFIAALLLLRGVERELLEFALTVLAPTVALIIGVAAFMLRNVGGPARDRLEQLAKTWGMLVGSLAVSVLLGFLLLVCWDRYRETVSAFASFTPSPSPVLVASIPIPTSTSTSTPTRALITTPGTTLCNGDFETSDLACWERDGDLDLSVVPLAGNHVALLGNPEYDCKGGVPVGGAILSQRVIVPTEGQPTLKLRYRIRSNDVLDKDKYDSFEAYVDDRQIRLDGNTEWNVADCDREAWDSGWREFTYPLDDFKGKTITLSFRNFNRVHEWYNTWAYVDDVEITP